MAGKGSGGLFASLAILGGLGLGWAGARAVLGLTPSSEDNFFDWQGPTEKDVDVGSTHVSLPVKYYREDSFAGFFGAGLEPVLALLPSPELYPVTLPGGRAVVAILALNYLETDVGPYGEIIVAIPCTYGQAAPPLLPLVFEAVYPGWGAFVVHMPVTSRAARDFGRVVYNFTKFVGDMAFEKQPSYQRVRLSEDGHHILTLTVRQRGVLFRDNRPLVGYSVRSGQLLKTTASSRSVYQLGLVPGGGTLEIGDHPVAEQLRQLDIDSRAIFTKNYLTRSGILPAGEPLGPARRAHDGYLGSDREYGQLTIRYDGRLVDVYSIWANQRDEPLRGSVGGTYNRTPV